MVNLNDEDMKKIELVISVLLSCIMSFSCNNDDDQVDAGTLIHQKESDVSVTSFLDNILPLNANDHLAIGFFTTPEYTRNDAHYVINSLEELKVAYNEDYGPKLSDLSIDFRTSTLIVGQERIDSGNILPGRKLRQSLYDNQDHYVLYLDYEGIDRDDVVELNDPRLVYYWGVYPKLSDKEIIIKVTLK